MTYASVGGGVMFVIFEFNCKDDVDGVVCFG